MPDFFKITCTLGWRLYEERFKGQDYARVFVETMLGKDKPRWLSPTKIGAKQSNTLTIECPSLEEIMETTGKATLHDDVKEKIQTFLYGVWKGPSVEGMSRDEPARKQRAAPDQFDDAPRSKRATNSGDDDSETLASICKRHGWDERRARRMLRDAGEKKQGRWKWAKSEIAGIEERLRKQFD